MAKAKCVNLSGIMAENPNAATDVDITDEIFDPDLLLRSFGISDDYCAPGDRKSTRLIQSRSDLVCRLLLEKKKKKKNRKRTKHTEE